MTDAQHTRRRFLGMSFGFATASTCGGCALFVTTRTPDLVLSPTDGALHVPEARFSELAGPQGSILLVDETSSERILVVRETAGRYRAVSATCTHIGCDVDYDARQGRIVCPCHGSEFDLEGRTLVGPATQPLRQYPVRTSEGEIVIAVAG